MVNETDSQVMAWNKALEEYKETHPNVTVKEDKTDNEAYKTKLKTTLAAGSAPDGILFLGRRIFPVLCKGRLWKTLILMWKAVLLIWIK